MRTHAPKSTLRASEVHERLVTDLLFGRAAYAWRDGRPKMLQGVRAHELVQQLHRARRLSAPQVALLGGTPSSAMRAALAELQTTGTRAWLIGWSDQKRLGPFRGNLPHRLSLEALDNAASQARFRSERQVDIFLSDLRDLGELGSADSLILVDTRPHVEILEKVPAEV